MPLKNGDSPTKNGKIADQKWEKLLTKNGIFADQRWKFAYKSGEMPTKDENP